MLVGKRALEAKEKVSVCAWVGGSQVIVKVCRLLGRWRVLQEAVQGSPRVLDQGLARANGSSALHCRRHATQQLTGTFRLSQGHLAVPVKWI